MERTFAMIKPDAIRANLSGSIISLIEQNRFNILQMRKMHMDRKTAEAFYVVHKERPFFAELVSFIISGPVIVMALEKENAIKDWRQLMGATDPKNAAIGTVRYMFGTDVGHNATHGSDAPETAKEELKLFFPEL